MRPNEACGHNCGYSYIYLGNVVNKNITVWLLSAKTHYKSFENDMKKPYIHIIF